jgi:pimeloyl-ACP methyl ester carboxylesterase
MNNFKKITKYMDTDEGPIYTSLSTPKNPRPDGLTLLLLHGAGKSNSDRYAELAKLFIEKGVAVLTLDFIGHGHTGGEVSSNSLALRTKHALATVDYWLENSVPLIVVGSSMSGHTALRVSSKLGDRVKTLGLLQPAVYAVDAEEVYFTPAFTKILHRPDSWKSSLALKDAANFEGRALIAIGTEDKVIPWGVIEALDEAIKQKSKASKLEVIEGVGHELATWLPEHYIAAGIINYLVEY